MVEWRRNHLEGYTPTAGSIDIKAFPPKQPGINRPGTRAEHYNTDGKCCDERMSQRVFTFRAVEGESDPEFVQSSERSRRRRPQTSK